jgi:hypothetical protein
LFDITKLSFIECATSGTKSFEKNGWVRARGENRMKPVTWATDKFIQAAERLNAQLQCERAPFQAEIIELKNQTGARRVSEKLADLARAL